VISFDRPGGIAWIVAYDPDGRVIAFAPSAPEWASPELVQAVNGALRAAVAGNCLGCGVARPPPPPGDWPVRVYVLDLRDGPAPSRSVASPLAPVSTDVVPHTEWCPWSLGAIARLASACRPPGERWAADMREEVTAALSSYIGGVVERLVSPGTA
jgi:hypothetical protein